MPKALPVIDISAPVSAAQLAAGPMTPDDALSIALRLKALADPVRVQLMSLLLAGQGRWRLHLRPGAGCGGVRGDRESPSQAAARGWPRSGNAQGDERVLPSSH